MLLQPLQWLVMHLTHHQQVKFAGQRLAAITPDTKFPPIDPLKFAPKLVAVSPKKAPVKFLDTATLSLLVVKIPYVLAVNILSTIVPSIKSTLPEPSSLSEL